MNSKDLFQEIEQLIRSTRDACKLIIVSARNILSALKRKKSRSCLWKAGIVNEPTSASLQGIRSTAPRPADHTDANYQYRCQRMADNLKDEIAMEELHYQGLKILKK